MNLIKIINELQSMQTSWINNIIADSYVYGCGWKLWLYLK